MILQILKLRYYHQSCALSICCPSAMDDFWLQAYLQTQASNVFAWLDWKLVCRFYCHVYEPHTLWYPQLSNSRNASNVTLRICKVSLPPYPFTVNLISFPHPWMIRHQSVFKSNFSMPWDDLAFIRKYPLGKNFCMILSCCWDNIQHLPYWNTHFKIQVVDRSFLVPLWVLKEILTNPHIVP